jgi:TRAP-type C4-dicarboxylate transport system substrate-binding protein
MSWSDAYTALQQGAIDGQENAAITIESNAVQEINKYLAMTDHIYGTCIVIASPSVWNSLSEDDQKILADCLAEANVWEREQARADAEDAIGRMEEQGLEVTYPDKQEFIDATAGIRAEYSQYKDTLDKIAALA